MGSPQDITDALVRWHNKPDKSSFKQNKGSPHREEQQERPMAVDGLTLGIYTLMAIMLVLEIFIIIGFDLRTI